MYLSLFSLQVSSSAQDITCQCFKWWHWTSVSCWSQLWAWSPGRGLLPQRAGGARVTAHRNSLLQICFIACINSSGGSHMKAKSSLPHIIKLCFICSVSDGHSLYNSNISRVATKIVECLLIQGRQASVSTTSQLLCTDINDSSTYQRGMEAPIFKMGTSRWSPVMESLCQDAAAKKTPADCQIQE